LLHAFIEIYVNSVRIGITKYYQGRIHTRHKALEVDANDSLSYTNMHLK
jgi:hypothetical protein